MAATMISSKLPCQRLHLPFHLIFYLEKKSSQPIEREREGGREIELFFIYLFLFERGKERERLKSILITRQ